MSVVNQLLLHLVYLCPWKLISIGISNGGRVIFCLHVFQRPGPEASLRFHSLLMVVFKYPVKIPIPQW